MKYTNKHNIALPIAVWLVIDEYDYVPDPYYISATTLLKSTRRVVLDRRLPIAEREIDLSDLLASRLGTALHDSMEKVWQSGKYKQAMKMLGYADKVIDNIVVNPTGEPKKDEIPVYLEKRSFKKVGKWTVGGKFDIVMQGRLFDNKSTSVYSYLLGSKDEDYMDQGSIYRWLNPEIIQQDRIYIEFFFTDWQRFKAKQDPNYPQTRSVEHIVPLKSMEKTQAMIEAKLAEIEKYMDAPDEEIPECTPEELWMSAPVFKYYADPSKMDGRATRNFDSMDEAQAFMASKGGKGAIKSVLGEPKACEYCSVFEICKQKDRYFNV